MRPDSLAQQATPLDRFREGLRIREAARLAPAVAAEKDRFLREVSRSGYQQKVDLLRRREQDLARETALMNEANQMGGINSANRAAHESYWRPCGSVEAWEDSIKVRKQAYEDLRKELGIVN